MNRARSAICTLDTRYQVEAGRQLQCARGACLLQGRQGQPYKRNLCTLACSRRSWGHKAVSSAPSTPSGLGSPALFRFVRMLIPIPERIVLPSHKIKRATAYVLPAISIQHRKCLVHCVKVLNTQVVSQYMEQTTPPRDYCAPRGTNKIIHTRGDTKGGGRLNEYWQEERREKPPPTR